MHVPWFAGVAPSSAISMWRYCKNGGQAMSVLVLFSMLTTLSASRLRHPTFSRPTDVLATTPTPSPTTPLSYRATDAPATLSGLQDAASTGTTPVATGHYLTSSGLFASTSYAAGAQNGGQKPHSSTGTTGTWGQDISYSAVGVNGDTRTDIFEDSTALNGITVDSVKFGQQNNVWLLDTSQGKAYKIDSSSSGSNRGTVSGVYKTSQGT